MLLSLFFKFPLKEKQMIMILKVGDFIVGMEH